MPIHSNPAPPRDRIIVDWQWVFAALWSSLCGSGSDRIKLCVPQTLLLRNGLPYKSLATDSNGYLVRKQIGPLLVTAPKGLSSLVVRKQLIDVVDSFGPRYGDDTATCSSFIAWHCDGRCEDVTRQDLFKMALSGRWRSQLVGIQECIVKKESSSNRFTGVVGPLPISTTGKPRTCTAANILAASIASRVERSYNKRGSNATTCNGLVVVSLVADFILDENQRLWFSHAKRLVVRYPATTISSRSLHLPGHTRVIDAEIEAKSAGERLRVALRSALQRKVANQTCFDHFDTDGVGYVGAGTLQDGLSRLGLEVSDGAAGMLMCWIARANGLHFGSNDLGFALRSELRLGGEARRPAHDSKEEGKDSLNPQALSSTICTRTCIGPNENGDGTNVPFEVELPARATCIRKADLSCVGNEGTTTCTSREESPETTSSTTSTVDDDASCRMASEDAVANANESSTYESDTSSSRGQESVHAPDNDNSKEEVGDESQEESGESSPTSCSTCSNDTPETKNSAPGTPPSEVQEDAEKRRNEIHLMRHEDKISFDAYRTDPNNVAAFQEAVRQGRGKARALRALAEEGGELDEMLNAGRRRAIKRERERVAVADAKQSAANLKLDTLNNNIEHLKDSLQLRLVQQQQQQQQQEQVQQDDTPDDQVVDYKGRTTAILDDITSSGEALQDVRSKQHQTQARLDECNNEVRSANRLIKQLQESLSRVANTSTDGTDPNVAPSIAAPFTARELRIRLDRAKKKLERATEQRDRAKKQLVNCNESVHLFTIAFRQKQRMGKDLFAWTKAESERCKGDTCQLRQQREDLEIESSLLERKISTSQRRIGAIQDEMECLHSRSTSEKKQHPDHRYFDTSLWHDGGLLQRMKTNDFIELVEKERSTLQNDLAVHHFRREEIIEEQAYIKKLLSDNSKLLALLSFVRGRLCNSSFLGASSEKFAEGETSSSNNGCTFTVASGGTATILPSSIVRSKRHDLLTNEEKEWVCLDYSINPQLYERKSRPIVTGGRPEGIAIVAPKVVRKILNLPEQIQHALPFLKSSQEVRAHFLINKYTLGRGELYFRAVDIARTCSCIGGEDDLMTSENRDPAHAVPPIKGVIKDHNVIDDVVIDVSQIQAEVKASSRDDNEEYVAIAQEMLPVAMEQRKIIDNDKSNSGGPLPFVFAALDDIIQAHNTNEEITKPPNLCFVSSSNIIEGLHDVSTLRIERGKRQKHRFVIAPPSRLHMVHNLIITVIFQGTQTATGYSPGRISASLARWLGSGDSNRQCPFTPIGYSLHEEQTVNTTTSMGRLVIRHCNVMPATYELLVTAESDARYSISIAGTIGTNAQLVLQQDLATFLQERHTIEKCEAKGSSLWNDMRLAERKSVLIDQLYNEASTELDRCKGDIEKCDLLLDKHNDEATSIDGRSIHQIYSDIKVLENEYTRMSFALAGREKERSDVRSDVEAMARLRHTVLDRAKKLNQSVATQRNILPLVASCFGNKFGVRVANLCESHFDLERAMSARDGATASSTAAAEVAEKIARLSSTPAEKVRRLARQEAKLSNLTTDEKSFCLLDRILNPSKWNWLDGVDDAAMAPSESEIRRIKSTPFDQLRRKADRDIKHCLLKYHDRALPTEDVYGTADNDAAAASPSSSLTTNIAATKAVNRGALAAKTRSKSPGLYSKADHEWQSIDVIIHPDEWSWRYGGRKPPVFSLRQSSDAWTCPFTRDEILAIWQSTCNLTSDKHLTNADQRRTYSLLVRYNGAFQDHSSSSNSGERDTEETGPRYRYSTRLRLQADIDNGSSNVDVDDQCHLIQAELDRAIFCRDDFLVSSILNGTPQRYPTHILRLELERELDRLLIDQILRREQEMEQPVLVCVDGGTTCRSAGATSIQSRLSQSSVSTHTASGESDTNQKVTIHSNIAALHEENDKLSSREIDTTNTTPPTSVNASGGSSTGKFIDHQARARHQRLQRTEAEEERQRELNRAENTVRFGLLLLVFGYFRSRHMVKEQQNKLSGARRNVT